MNRLPEARVVTKRNSWKPKDSKDPMWAVVVKLHLKYLFWFTYGLMTMVLFTAEIHPSYWVSFEIFWGAVFIGSYNWLTRWVDRQVK